MAKIAAGNHILVYFVDFMTLTIKAGALYLLRFFKLVPFGWFYILIIIEYLIIELVFEYNYYKQMQSKIEF